MRKKVMAVVIAVLAFSLIAASAATLGVTSTSGVGAGDDLVAACDDNVDVDFTVAETSQDVVEVTAVTVTDIAAACDGENIFVTVYESGVAAGTASGTVSGTSITLTGFSADPELLDLVRVVIG